ncbi:aspartate aminotransferase family protein [Acidobacteriota bacterium]
MTDTLVEDYIKTHPKSQQIHSEAVAHFSGEGATHIMRISDPFRPYISHARGSRKWDVDGNEYIDYIMGHGALILGHSHPAIVRAVQEQMAKGVHFGENNEVEVELARLIKMLFPSSERVEFCSSGQEANLLAIRLSRLFTHRKKILRFAEHYHGWADELAPVGSAGVVANQVTLIPSNDFQKVEKELSTRKYAALIMEGGGGILGVQTPLDIEFVQAIQEITRKMGTVWILDEVVTGFRSAPGGWQSQVGVKPDLTTLGKCLGGGLPVGAVTGRADIMDALSSRSVREKRMEHGGTWNAVPLVCAAGVAACRIYQTGYPQKKARNMAELFITEGNRILEERQLAGRIYGHSIAKLCLDSDGARTTGRDGIKEDSIADLFNSQSIPVKERLCLHLLQRGIATLEGSFFIFSAAHTKKDVRQTLETLSKSLDALLEEGFLKAC